MDPHLFTFLSRTCHRITPEQCLSGSGDPPPTPCLEDTVDTEMYDGSNPYEHSFYLQMVDLYSRRLHPFLPELVATWRVKPHSYYIQTAPCDGLDTLNKVGEFLSGGVLISILAELCTTIQMLHGMGIHHGLLHESSVFMSADLKQVYLKGFAARTCAREVEFVTLKKKDLADLDRLLFRISAVRMFDFRMVNASLQLRDCTALPGAVAALRNLAFLETLQTRCLVLDWQENIKQMIVATHEMVQIDIPDVSTHEAIFKHCLVACVSLLSTEGGVSNSLPVFGRAGAVERGVSASVPIVNALFDYAISTHLLTVHDGVSGLLPTKRLLIGDWQRQTFMFLGYIIAYCFVLNIPLQCQLSPFLVAYVMQQTASAPSTSHIRMPTLSKPEHAAVLQTRAHLCHMRAGARKLTDLSFFGRGLPANKLFEFFYDCRNNVTIPELGMDSFAFDNAYNPHEKMVVMAWIRALAGTPRATHLTQLITNSAVVPRRTTRILVKKNHTGLLHVTTCEQCLDLPALWLANSATLAAHMDLQLNDMSFNTS